MNGQASETGTGGEQTGWGDSPWLWVACFCGMGLVALWAASAKYPRRQAQVESHYRARQYQLAHNRQVHAAADDATVPVPAPPTGPPRTIIHLLPIAVPLAVGLVVSLTMLWRHASRLGVR